MNIILQHYEGPLGELEKLSVENIKGYANTIGADYKLVTGKPFREHLTLPCQKACIINEKWDQYENVLMLDPDVFIRKNLVTNIFNIPGHGVNGFVQNRLKRNLIRRNKLKEQDPYSGGSIYKFSLKERQKLRSVMPKDDRWLDFYNRAYHYEDEGILAELAGKCNFGISYLDFKWSQCSFLPKPEEAYMIHIRTKLPGRADGSWENGGKRPKIENYYELHARGII